MAKQGTLNLFPEIEQVTQKMTDEQFGRLMRAAFAYRFRGEVYGGNDVAVDIAFQFISSQIDRGEDAKAAKSKAAKDRWSMQSNAEGMQSDAQPMQSDAEGMQSDAPILSVPILSNPIHSSNNESKADKPPAPTKQTKKSFGEFGWVKLTDDEYNRLLNDLGEAEVKRCIAYVDESAQSTGNKNKWRDWNLVVRKCHKQGWGANQAQYRRNQPQTGPRVMDQDEIDAIHRMMQEDTYA